MIIFLYGADTYRLHAQLHKMQDKFIQDRDPSGMNVVTLDLSQSDAQNKELLLAAPFLAQKRMVIVPRLFEQASKILFEWFEQQHTMLALREDTVFVLWTELEKVKKAQSALFDVLRTQKFAQQFELPSGAQLKTWIKKLVGEYGGTIEPGAVTRIADALADDSWKLANRLHQLVMYCADRAITIKDVDIFVEAKTEDAIFALMDAITQKDRSRALQLLESQWRYGAEPMQVFGMLVRQYRILLDLHSAQQEHPNENPADLAKKLGLHPFVVKKTLPLLGRYRKVELINGERILLVMDRKIKTGAASMRELLHWVVVV